LRLKRVVIDSQRKPRALKCSGKGQATAQGYVKNVPTVWLEMMNRTVGKKLVP
jgi:hypothetical protein